MLCYGRKLLTNQEKIHRTKSLILLITKGQCLFVPSGRSFARAARAENEDGNV